MEKHGDISKHLLFVNVTIWIFLLIMILIKGDDDLIIFLNNNPPSDAFKTAVEGFTDMLYGIIAIVALLGLFSVLIPKLRPYKPLMLGAWLSYALSFIFIYVLKMAIARPRPYVKLPSEINSFGIEESDYSMPSGHSGYSASTLTPYAFKAKNLVIAIIINLIPWIMMYTRLYLGVHFVSDVLVGNIIGTLCGYVVINYVGKLYAEQKMTKTIEIPLVIIAFAITLYSALM